MNAEDREESRPRKVIPSVRREGGEQQGERQPYNQNYNRPERGNYERKPYNNTDRNDRGGDRSYGGGRPSYGDNRPSYGNNRPSFGNREDGNRSSSYNNDRPISRPQRPSFNNDGGESRERNFNSYNNSGNDRPAYGNREGGSSRPSFNNNRPSFGNREGGSSRPSFNNGGNSYGGNSYGEGNSSYNRPARPFTSSQVGGDGEKKRRPRVGDTRVNNYEENSRPSRPSFDSRDGGNNRPSRPSFGNDRPSRPSFGGGNSRPNSYGDNNRGGYNNNSRGGFSNDSRKPIRRSDDYNPNAKYSLQKQLKYKEVLADPNEPIRLNKYLANAGVCSRREADELIQNGFVTVNGEVVTELGTKITRQDNVVYKEKEVQIEGKIYMVLNKPKNCVTTSDDPQERLTVMDLVKSACQERIYPVGRLDRNTTGVLLLTNDGDLASKLTHPSFKKKKIYHVWLDKNVTMEDMAKIADGIELEDGEIHADAISYASEDDKSQVGIEIHSGRNRIVRRIFEALGYHVMKLDRVYFAGLTKKNLPRGKWRYLNEKEVNALRMGAFE